MYLYNIILNIIPNYNSFDYVSALESLTMDDSAAAYIFDDPWKNFISLQKNFIAAG
jgi:hypothetical protein